MKTFKKWLKFLQRKLPPQAFSYVRTICWYSYFYFPRSIASTFAKQLPTVSLFAAGRPSETLQKLAGINTMAPTEICRIMTKYYSDKGDVLHHTYTTIYNALFSGLRKQTLKVFEIGLGTVNQELASHMDEGGRPGASLRGWRQFFPNALVYGADIDRDVLFEDVRIKTWYCDQCDSAAISELWAQPELQGGVDILVEDGLHTFDANLSFLNGSLEMVRPNGFYIVEDIHVETFPLWKQQLETVYTKRYTNYEFALIQLSDYYNRNNNLLVAHRLN